LNLIDRVPILIVVAQAGFRSTHSAIILFERKFRNGFNGHNIMNRAIEKKSFPIPVGIVIEISLAGLFVLPFPASRRG
jgi:hypothetical protein